MKSLLVIDMPNDCAECQFCGFGGRNLEKYVCCLTREHSEEPHLVGCPLKPLPDRQKAKAGAGGYTRGFTAGFNKFRYLIAGEENEDESNTCD